MSNRYDSLGLLADGGMADIELARDTRQDQLVAIKRIKDRHCKDAEFTRMFEDEAQIWARLKHPNIVALLDHGCDSRGPYIAMQLIDGCDVVNLLHAHLDSGLQLDLALTIATALLDALSYLHEVEDSDGQEMHLVHRDISPGNILCSRDGQIKLTDFGVVQAAVKTHQTRVGDLKGKFAYMSPEQTRGEVLTAASDLFSAGVVLWEMLSGRPLFDRPTDIDTAQAVRETQVPSLRIRRPDLPKELDAVLADMLNSNPQQRILRAETAAQRLRRVAREQGLRLGPDLVARAVEHCVADQAPLLQRVKTTERRHTRIAAKPPLRAGRSSMTARRAGLVTLGIIALGLGAWQVSRRTHTSIDTIAGDHNTSGPDIEPGHRTVPPPLLAGSDSMDSGTLAKLLSTQDAAQGGIDAGRMSSLVQPAASLDSHAHAQLRPRPRPRTRLRPAKSDKPRPPPVMHVQAHNVDAGTPTHTGIGWLDISSDPWAQVAVDGVAIGNNTPLRKHALPAGRHRITLHNPVFDITRTIEISIQAGQHTRRRVDLMQR